MVPGPIFRPPFSVIEGKIMDQSKKFEKGGRLLFLYELSMSKDIPLPSRKVACPLFSALKKRGAPIHFYPKSKSDSYIVNNLNYSRVEIAADARRGP